MKNLNEAKRAFGQLTYAQRLKQIKDEEKAKKAGIKPVVQITPPSIVQPPLKKSMDSPTSAAPIKAKASGEKFDPMTNNYAGGSADARAAKHIFNAASDYESGALKASDPRSKEIENFAKKQFKLVNDFIKRKFNIPQFNIKASLIWDGAAKGITAGTDMQAKTPFCFFDFSRYYKYPGDLNQYKWKRLEYDEMDTDSIIGSVYKASWQDCVTISICHEFCHAIQSCKDIEILQKVTEALPKYTGNCDDGLHGEFFKALYRCIRGNIMGTKKENQVLSFSKFLSEVEKKKVKREIKIPKLPSKITEPELVSLDN